MWMTSSTGLIPPLIASIMSHPPPSKLKMLTLDSYDGTRNPCDHIATFKATMHL